MPEWPNCKALLDWGKRKQWLSFGFYTKKRQNNAKQVNNHMSGKLCAACIG
jgi:hypothetical protein